MDELSEEDKLVVLVHVVYNVSYLSLSTLLNNLQVLKVKFVDIEDTIKGFNMILNGEVDEYPEAAFNLKIDLTNVPKHIAIIMDGNGRWAQQQGEERLFGHNFGIESVRRALQAADDIGVKFLTMYAFSTENWSRPQEEVDGIMDLIVKSISREVDGFNEKGVRVLCIGDIKGLPQDCQDELAAAIESTKNNKSINLVLALNYSSRWEIKHAIEQIASDVKENKISVEHIDDDFVHSYLSTKHIPDPELLIRTSGEYRLSNFFTLANCLY
jgi:undecaprenyl diphosphate synthase